MKSEDEECRECEDSGWVLTLSGRTRECYTCRERALRNKD